MSIFMGLVTGMVRGTDIAELFKDLEEIWLKRSEIDSENLLSNRATVKHANW